MKVLFSLVVVVLAISSLNACKDDTLCITFMKEAFDTYCPSFLKVPCPDKCGKCASDNLQAKFYTVFKPDAIGNVGFEEGLALLKLLNVNSDEAFVTELKDLIFDSKTGFTDFYQFIDADKNGDLTLSEFFSGIVKFMEVLGVTFKPEMKTNVNLMGDIAKTSLNQGNNVVIPKLNEALNFFMGKLDSLPHGLITMIKLQSLNTTRHLDLSRIIIPFQSTYTINGKQLVWDILDGVDLDDDGIVTLRELLGFIFMNLNLFNVNIPVEVHQNINNYLTMLDFSVDALLKKYGFTDVSQLNDKILPELNNQKFVDYRIKIKEAAMTTKQFLSTDVMKYFKTITNALPQRKLTIQSIKEAIFVTLDKNQDFSVDLDEFTPFGLVTLGRIGASFKDIDELTRVFKLYDVNGDRRLDEREFLEMFRKL